MALLDELRKRAQQLALSRIGAAPHPVQINSPQVINKIQNAKYGVLAQGNNRNIAINQLNNAQRQATPTVSRGLNNAMDAINNTNAQAGRFVVQNIATRRAMEVGQTVRQHFTHQPSSYTPGSAWEKQIFGDTRIDSIQKVHDDTGADLRKNSNPAVRQFAGPLANVNTALHVANDIPVVGAAVKYGTKGAKIALPVIGREVSKVAPKAIPAVQGATKAVTGTVKTARSGAINRQAQDAGKAHIIRQLSKENQAIQQQLQALPVNNYKAAEILQRKLDRNNGIIQNTQGAKRTATQQVTDRILTAQPGMSMKAVHGSDLHPEQNQFIEDYATLLKQQGEGNGVDILSDGRRVSNNMRAAGDKGKRLTNADYFNKARAEIESGKAPFGLSDHYRELTAGLQEQPLEIPAGFENIGKPKVTSSTKKQLVAKVAVNPKPTKQLKAPVPVKPAPNLNPKQYVKEQAKAQKIARNKDNPASIKAKLNAAKTDVKSKLVDSFAPIEDKVNTAVKKGANITPGNNIKYQIDRALRAKTIAGQYAKDNGLHKVIQNVKNTDEFDQYLIARHTADVTTKTGRDAAKDATLVKALEGKYEAQAKQVDQYSQKLLDKSVEYGLISKELASQLKAQYPKYVPINRVFTELEQQGVKGSAKSPASISQQTVVQRLKGSDREIESPLSSILEKTEHVIEQGERNKAASILASYKDLPDNPFGLKELKPTETVGTRPVISYLDNGKQRRFETTPEVATAAKALNKQQLGFVGQIFAVPTRILRLGATSINVGFTLANVAKDTASGFINSKHALTMADPTVFLKALKAASYHGSKEYGELVREGAGGTSFDIARNEAVANVKKIRAGKNIGTRALYTATHPGALLRAIEDTIGRGEELGRAVQYYGNKGAFGKSNSASDATILAADAARNNTVNFSRAGDYGRAANTLLPYLNAGIQGARTFVRTAKDRPLQTAAKVVLTAFVPMAATTAWNLGDPKRKEAYDSLSDTEKENNFILVPPNPKLDKETNRWNVIKVPMSQEIAGLASSVRNGVEALHGDKAFNFKHMASDLLGTATSIKTGSAREFLGQVTPQALKPGLETVMNQNLFTGNDVVKKKLKNLDARDQYDEYTSGTAKVLGRVTKGSPMAIDNALRTATGGTGQNIIHSSDQLLARMGLIKKEDIKGKSLGKSIADRFYGAQAKSDSVIAKEVVKDKLKQLKQLPDFKAMTQDEQAKALNRLETAANNAVYQTQDAKNQTGQYAPDYKGKTDKLSPREAGLVDGSTNIRDFLKPATGGNGITISPKLDKKSTSLLQKYDAMSTDDRDKAFNKDNKAEFEYSAAKYLNDRANGSLSTTEDINAVSHLRKLKIGQNYSKNVRDLYTLSKAELNNYLNNAPNGGELYNQLQAYDQALYDNGASTSLKFKNGLASGKGGRKKTSYKSNLSGVLASVKSGNSKAKTYQVRKQSLSAKIASSTMKSYAKPKLTLNKKA